MAEHSTSLDQDKYITQLALWKKGKVFWSDMIMQGKKLAKNLSFLWLCSLIIST